VAVDTAGNIYITDSGNDLVMKLAARATTPSVLPFTGLNSPGGVAVDTAGNIYITNADWKTPSNNQVLKLPVR
jgi:serine/threonine protein kinase, bacterial